VRYILFIVNQLIVSNKLKQYVKEFSRKV